MAEEEVDLELEEELEEAEEEVVGLELPEVEVLIDPKLIPRMEQSLICLQTL